MPWFQAEKTRANPVILAGKNDIGGLSPRDIIRTADILAWPSDVSAWSRFCYWALHTIANFPVAVIPDLLSAFEVWQNMFADLPNDVSRKILALTTGWLEDIEDREHAEEFRYDPGPWEGLRRGELAELEQRLRWLLLRSARLEVPRVQAYLDRVLARPRLRRHAYAAIVAFSAFLTEHHARAVVELTLERLSTSARDDRYPVGLKPSLETTGRLQLLKNRACERGHAIEKFEPTSQITFEESVARARHVCDQIVVFAKEAVQIE